MLSGCLSISHSTSLPFSESEKNMGSSKGEKGWGGARGGGGFRVWDMTSSLQRTTPLLARGVCSPGSVKGIVRHRFVASPFLFEGVFCAVTCTGFVLVFGMNEFKEASQS